MGETRTSRIRRDGWTPERQLRFLDALARTRSVIAAARDAGMSRESAYRLRERREGALFALLWDRTLQGHDVRYRSVGARSGDDPVFNRGHHELCDFYGTSTVSTASGNSSG
jgi:hypothetical protein